MKDSPGSHGEQRPRGEDDPVRFPRSDEVPFCRVPLRGDRDPDESRSSKTCFLPSPEFPRDPGCSLFDGFEFLPAEDTSDGTPPCHLWWMGDDGQRQSFRFRLVAKSKGRVHD